VTAYHDSSMLLIGKERAFFARSLSLFPVKLFFSFLRTLFLPVLIRPFCALNIQIRSSRVRPTTRRESEDFWPDHCASPRN
jgi:hypothetical protein